MGSPCFMNWKIADLIDPCIKEVHKVTLVVIDEGFEISCTPPNLIYKKLVMRSSVITKQEIREFDVKPK